MNQQKFLSLKQKWQDDTCFMSNMTHKFQHPAYQEIMSFGKENPEECIKLILEDLIHNGLSHWFGSLIKISDGDFKFPENHRGAMGALMVDALIWGRERGYIE